MGTEIGMLGGSGFQGQVTAGDGSDKKGKMRAGYNNFRRKQREERAPAKIGLNWQRFYWCFVTH